MNCKLEHLISTETKYQELPKVQSSKNKIKFLFSLLFSVHFYGLLQSVLCWKVPLILIWWSSTIQLLVAVFQIPEIIFKLWSRFVADSPSMKIVFLDVALVLHSCSLNRGSEVHTHMLILHTLHTVLHMRACTNIHTKTQKKFLQAHIPCLSLSLLKETLRLNPKNIIILHRDSGMEFPSIRW